jgi:succinate dehydrogenase flavin-adding protein (antitoxin of CptAB toxin-antitoxin module)
MTSQKNQKRKMTKNSEIYGKRIYYESGKSRVIEQTDSIVDSIIDEHIKRAKMGKEKYGQTLDRTDLSLLEYLQHAKEEAMDLALYLEKAIQLINGKVEKSDSK